MPKLFRFSVLFLFFLLFCPKNSLSPIYVNTSLQLSDKELELTQRRKPLEETAILNFMQQLSGYAPAPGSKIPKIAITGSGGGYRAMLVKEAGMYAMQSINLFQGISYMAGLSGSTWALVSMLTHNMTPVNFKEKIKDLVQRSLWHIDKKEFHEMLAQFEKKYGTCWELHTTPLDLWGALIAKSLFAGLPDVQNINFDTIRRNLNATTFFPYPLCCTVNTDVYPYKWVEVDPFYTSGDYLRSTQETARTGSKIPTMYFNSVFQAGQSTKLTAELSAGVFMAMFGSAYNFSLAEILKFIAKAIADPELLKLIKWLTKILKLYEVRLLETPLNNFVYNMQGGELTQFPKAKYSDAGMDFNLPLPILLKPEREVDVIIVFDASSDARQKGFPELYSAKAYAQRKRLPFPPLNNPKIVSDYCAIFEDPINPKVPTIIYFANPIPESTLKLQYSNSEFDEIFNPNFANIVNARKEISDAIVRKTEQLNRTCFNYGYIQTSATPDDLVPLMEELGVRKKPKKKSRRFDCCCIS